MDPFSQGLVGAVVAQSAARKANIRKAALIGCLAGLAPDLDVLIRSGDDPMFNIAMHRHFTHALAFTPIGAFIVAGLLWLMARRRLALPFKTVYLFAFVGYLTHGPLDACTSYGTVLYWPFSEERVAWNVISIIDPLFTFGIVLCAVVFAYWKRSRTPALIGTLIGLAYLGFGYSQKIAATELTQELAARNGHEIEHLFVSQSLGNQFLWRSVYVEDGTMYMQAVYVMPFGQRWITHNYAVKRYDPELDLPEIGEGQQRDDLRFFAQFASTLIGPFGDDPHIIADYRYGLAPQGAAPIWGVRITPGDPGAHVKMARFHDRSSEGLQGLFEMIQGNPPTEPAIWYKE